MGAEDVLRRGGKGKDPEEVPSEVATALTHAGTEVDRVRCDEEAIWRGEAIRKGEGSRGESDCET